MLTIYDMRQGDEVVLISINHRDSQESAPIWGEEGTFITGTVLDVNRDLEACVVEWSNGITEPFCPRKDGSTFEYRRKVDQGSIKLGNKNIKLNFEPLNKLILEPQIKEEIISVLKQHENSKKIFEDWGLGEMLEYGKGMTFMFYGSPGTGKTWAANCIAKCLGVELLVIGAAEIQTSEPGGANRNIQNAFAAAKGGKKVLFLDECDSLITARNDVGMILGSEINTLLTEIEKFEGVCILATNRIDTLDEALERRISLIIEFPEPNFDQRKDIWATLIPKKMPLGEGVSPEVLAEHKLTGGQIKNVLLQSARLAVAAECEKVEQAHFDAAISRVQGSKNLMGTASRYRQVKVMDGFGKSSGGKKKVASSDTDLVMP